MDDDKDRNEDSPAPVPTSPTLDEVLDRAGKRTGGSISFEAAVKALRQDRESH